MTGKNLRREECCPCANPKGGQGHTEILVENQTNQGEDPKNHLRENPRAGTLRVPRGHGKPSPTERKTKKVEKKEKRKVAFFGEGASGN